MNILFLSICVQKSNRDLIAHTFIVKEMETLAARGHNVYFLAEGIMCDQDINNVKYLSSCSLLESNKYLRRFNNLLFFVKNLFFFGFRSIFYFKTSLGICGYNRSIIKLSGKHNISIVHSHFFSPHGECGVSSSLYTQLPVVCTLRGAELYSRDDLDYGAMLDRKFKYFFQRSSQKVSLYTAPNRELVSMLMSDYNLVKNKVIYLPNGVEKISGSCFVQPDTMKSYFIVVARFIRRKNIKLIIDAFNKIDLDVDLYIVGEGPLKEQFEDMVHRNEMNKVRLLPEIGKVELYSLISASLCLINASHIEGLPNVVMESLSLGVPCIVSDIVPHRELIREGVNGYLFNGNDVNSLICKVATLYCERKSWSSKSEVVKKTVAEFSLERKIDSYEKIYCFASVDKGKSALLSS